MEASLDVEARSIGVGPGPGPAARGGLPALLAGLRLPFEGLALLWRERRLWPLAALPVLLSLAAFAGAVALVMAHAGELHAFATAWAPELSAERWWQWLWIGPARALLAALGAALFLALAAAAIAAAFLLASLAASPFHDALAARVEQIESGRVVDEPGAGLRAILREGARSLREELRRLLFFLSLTLPLLLVGALVPGALLLTAPALAALTIFFLPLDYASYTLDRRRMAFRDKRRWLFAHKAVTAGFGLAAFCVCSVPGLAFLAMPALVTAGTLLALRFAPLGPAGAGAVNPADAGAGTATSP
jgi:CysZ protein